MEDSKVDLFDFSNMSVQDVCMMNPLQMAYIGDAVYEVYIRSYLVSKYKKNVNEMHKLSVKFVKASAQSHLLEVIEPFLTEEESNIVRRGRNTKTNHVPKNAQVIDYRRATAFEALIGYLHLTKNYERVHEIIKIIIESTDI